MKTNSRFNIPFLPQTGENTIILDDLDFGFENTELDFIVNKWNEGNGIDDISETLGRKELEVLLALIHSARIGRISRPFAWRRV